MQAEGSRQPSQRSIVQIEREMIDDTFNAINMEHNLDEEEAKL